MSLSLRLTKDRIQSNLRNSQVDSSIKDLSPLLDLCQNLSITGREDNLVLLLSAGEDPLEL